MRQFCALVKLQYQFYPDLLHLIENTFDRKRIYANPSSYPNSQH